MLTMGEIIDLAKGGGDYQDIAKALKVNKGSISKWRQGLAAPDPEYIPELARLAGLSVPAVAIAALATRDRKQAKAKFWSQAWEQLDRKGCILCKTEGHRRRRQHPARLSGRVNHHQPALKAWRRGTLLRAWHCLLGYSTFSREGLTGASWPMLGLMPA